MKSKRSGSGSRLLRLRNILGLSQRQMAQEFKVSAAAIAHWERAAREIPGPVKKLIEIYESELPLFKSVAEERLPGKYADDLLNEIFSEVPLRDAAMIARLRAALSDYIAAAMSENVVRQRILVLALARLARTLGEVKGLPMKVAQVAAFLDPRVPQELREIFSTLQYYGRPMPFSQIVKVFEEDFDLHPDKLFKEFSRRPVAAASLGQVHRARLKSGEEVAVKIQYPNVRKILEADFGNLQFVEQLMQLVKSKEMDLIANIQEVVLSECDYGREAANQQRFHECYKNDPDILVPEVFPKYSRTRVLTTAWVDGLNWPSFKAQATQAEKNKAASTIAKYYAESAFRFGLLQTDPHFGNFLFTKKKVAFLDFGRVHEWNQADLSELRDMYHLVMSGDATDAKKFFARNTIIQTGADFNVNAFWEMALKQSPYLRDDTNFKIDHQFMMKRSEGMANMGKLGTFRLSPSFFWSILYTNALLVVGRADLEATANWRDIVSQCLLHVSNPD